MFKYQACPSRHEHISYEPVSNYIVKPIMSSGSAQSTAPQRSFATHLRAFVSESRIGTLSAAHWNDFAHTTLNALLRDESETTIRSALNLLEKNKPSHGEDTTRGFIVEGSTLAKLNDKLRRLKKKDDQLYVLAADTFGIPTTSTEEEQNDDGSIDANQVNVGNARAGQKKDSDRSAVCGKRCRQNDDEDNNENEIVGIVPPSLSSSSVVAHRPAFAFHLLKTSGLPCDGDAYIGIEDVVPCGGKLCMVFTFQLDIDWLLTNLPALYTFSKVIIVHGASAEEQSQWQEHLVEQDAGMAGRFAWVRPNLPTYGTMHTKMFLSFYEVGCRVCIHSANCVKEDWEFKTQAAYMRDFPVHRSSSLASPSSTTRLESEHTVNDFGIELNRYMEKALATDKSALECVHRELTRMDFSSAGVALVGSVPGRHKGDDLDRFGHMRLRAVLSKHMHTDRADEAAAGRDAVAICQFSSLGSVAEAWLLNEFGQTLMTRRRKDGHGDRVMADSGEIQLVYPTVNQVEQSSEGLQAGTSIPVRTKNLKRPHITSRLHKWDASISGRDKAMPHMKSFVRYEIARGNVNASKKNKTGKTSAEQGEQVQASWVFIGSFNLSVAAWGRLQIKQTQLNILSFELGVLFCPSLWCKAVFALPEAVVKYSVAKACTGEDKEKKGDMDDAGVGSKTRTKKRTKRSEATEIETRFCLYRFREHKHKEHGGNGNGDVLLPLPYRVPPKPYEKGLDTPWTIEQCAMM